jgi:hypothetical protein
MHLLYLDDSGSVGNASDKHLVLAGLAIHEKRGHWLSKSLNDLAARVWPDSPATLEFRASDIRSGKKHWRGVGRQERNQIYRDALKILADSPSDSVRLFGVAAHKIACSPEDPMEYAFEQACSRFDHYLSRLHKKGNTQRGIIILDKSSYETSLQGLAKDFANDGHRWGHLHNIAEVPLFVDSTATRLIQFADMVAYALRRYYEAGDDEFFEIIKSKFDAEGGVIHGLKHHKPQQEACGCHYCRLRPI